MKTLSRVRLWQLLACMSSLLSMAACSLGSPSSNRVVISLPEGGFKADPLAYSPSVARKYAAIRTASSPGSGGGDDFPMPTSLADFDCIGVMVSGSGIDKDPLFDDECVANPNLSNSGLGKLVGLVPASGGVLDIQVPSGPSRLIQLIGVQTDGSCPTLFEAMKRGDPASGANHIPLGEPMEIGRAQVDIFADQTVEIRASFLPEAAESVFSCHSDDHNDHEGGGPLELADVSLFPHFETGNGKARVIGRFVGGFGTVGLFSDPGCQNPYSIEQHSGGFSGFSVTTTLPLANVDVYVRASSASQVSPCILAGTKLYNPAKPSVRVHSPFPGMMIDGNMTQLSVSGDCSPPYGGDVHFTLGGANVGICSCGMSGFSCGAMTLPGGLPDGPLLLEAQMVATSGGYIADDAVLLKKDALAPGLSISIPSQSMALLSGTAGSSFVMSGACGAIGGSVTVSVYNGSQDVVLGTTSCAANAWSMVTSLMALPDGPLYVKVAHWGASGQEHASYSGVSVEKNASVREQFNYYSPRNSTAASVTRVGSTNTVFAAGNGMDVGVVPHWLVRREVVGAWSASDDYLYPSSSNGAEALAIAHDSTTGNVYAAGFATNSGGQSRWILRRSTDNGVTWGTMDDFALYGTSPSMAFGVGVSASGAVYVVGYGQNASSQDRWIVRKSTDYGTTWSTVDDFALTAGTYASRAISVGFGSGNNVYVGGYGQDATYHPVWVLRHFDGTTWSTAPTMDPVPAASYQRITGIAVDTSSNTVYAAGESYDAGTGQRMTVYSYNGGWTALDNFLPPSSTGGFQNVSSGSVFFYGGSVYVAGYVQWPTLNQGRYIVRRGNSGGTQWATSSFASATAGGSGARGVYVDASGIYSCGSAFGGVSAQTDWIVKTESTFY